MTKAYQEYEAAMAKIFQNLKFKSLINDQIEVMFSKQQFEKRKGNFKGIIANPLAK